MSGTLTGDASNATVSISSVVPSAISARTLAHEAANWPSVEFWGVSSSNSAAANTGALNNAFQSGAPLRMPEYPIQVTNGFLITNQNFRLYFPSRTSGGLVVDQGNFNMASGAVFYFQVPTAGPSTPDANAGPVVENLRIRFVQPNSQSRGDIIQYPPAVVADATRFVELISPRIVGAYRGIVFAGDSGGSSVRNAELYCFGRHIEMDGPTDSMHFSNIRFEPFEVADNQLNVYYDEQNVGWLIGRCDYYQVDGFAGFMGGRQVIIQDGAGGGNSFGIWTNYDFDTWPGVTLSGGGTAIFNGGYFTMGAAGVSGGTTYAAMYGLSVQGSQFRCKVSNTLFLQGIACTGGATIVNGSNTAGNSLTLTGNTFTQVNVDQTVILNATDQAALVATGNIFERSQGVSYAATMVYLDKGQGVFTGNSFIPLSPDNTGPGVYVGQNANFTVTGNNFGGYGAAAYGGVPVTGAGNI